VVSQLYSIVGGEENFAAMQAWAKENADPEAIAAFDRAMSSGDRQMMQFAVKGMFAEFSAADTGDEPAERVSGKATSGGVKPFADMREWKAAMADPRYQKSQKFRDEVRARLAVSKAI
jgi:hypothetical protein